MLRPSARIACLPVTSATEIASVAQLARQIWQQHYTPIIGPAQVAYMLEQLQSEAAIAAQITTGYEYFLVGDTNPGNIPCGYFAVMTQADTSRLFISKFYLSVTARGQGIARVMLEHMAMLARQRRLTVLWLTVNKYNPALQIYLHLGFRNVGSVVADIGNGFVMDDYQLEKSV